ncbi:hypothetical protein ACFSQ7_40695 [Paenibacillus rhizoplanae]
MKYDETTNEIRIYNEKYNGSFLERNGRVHFCKNTIIRIISREEPITSIALQQALMEVFILNRPIMQMNGKLSGSIPMRKKSRIFGYLQHRLLLSFKFMVYIMDALKPKTNYTVGGKGIEITNTVVNNAKVDTLPRIGLSFKFSDAWKKMKWYGRGPWEKLRGS